MVTYVISPADEKNRMLARSFPDRASAMKTATHNDHVITDAIDVRWSGRVLHEVYIALGGTHKREFATRDEGLAAIFGLLQKVAR